MKFAIFLVVTLAIVSLSSAQLPVGHALGRANTERPDEYYPAIYTIVRGDDDRFFQSDEDSSPEQDQPRRRSRLTYRSGRTEWRQAPKPVYDYGLYDRQQGSNANRLQMKDERGMQYGDEQKWSIYPKQESTQSSVPRRRVTPSPESTTAVPTKLPPRLLLKSGDNVHFGEGINWSVYKTGEGLTRVGTRDGEVVVRVVRPSYEDFQRRKAIHPYTDIRSGTTEPLFEVTTQGPVTTTPYQWQWQPCYTEQECYRQYVNEYYRFYAHHQ